MASLRVRQRAAWHQPAGTPIGEPTPRHLPNPYHGLVPRRYKWSQLKGQSRRCGVAISMEIFCRATAHRPTCQPPLRERAETDQPGSPSRFSNRPFSKSNAMMITQSNGKEMMRVRASLRQSSVHRFCLAFGEFVRLPTAGPGLAKCVSFPKRLTLVAFGQIPQPLCQLGIPGGVVK